MCVYRIYYVYKDILSSIEIRYMHISTCYTIDIYLMSALELIIIKIFKIHYCIFYQVSVDVDKDGKTVISKNQSVKKKKKEKKAKTAKKSKKSKKSKSKKKSLNRKWKYQIKLSWM